MKSFLTLASLLALVAAAPCHRPRSTITLRLYSTAVASNHYIAVQQIPTTPRGATLNVLVGQVLSLDHAPLKLQGIEIARVTEGANLSNSAIEVEEDDARIRCKAKVGYGSNGAVFGIKDGLVVVGMGEGVDVTGLECWLEEDKEV